MKKLSVEGTNKTSDKVKLKSGKKTIGFQTK